MNLDLDAHPLGRSLHSATNAEDWMQAFSSTTRVEHLTGLLHAGLQIEQEDPCAMISFYLRVADGYSDERNFARDGENRNLSKNRHTLSVYAWHMLKQRYFAPYKDEDGDTRSHFYSGGFSRWSPVLYTEDGYVLLSNLIAFFTERESLPNLPYDPEGQRFVLRFAQWIVEGGPRGHNVFRIGTKLWRDKIAVLAQDSIPQALYLLDHLGKLEIIPRLHISNLEPVLDGLANLAMRSRYSHYKKYESIEHAMADGNKAAMTHTIITVRENARKKYNT